MRAFVVAMVVGVLAVGCAVVGAPLVVFAAVVGGLGGGPGSGPPAPSSPPSAAATSIPPAALAAYHLGATYCPGLAWGVLAGIGEVESDHGRSTAPGVASGANAAGAEGPMQFLPATFAEYAVPVNGDTPTPYDIDDAAVAAARLLCANGALRPSGLGAAIWSYNHSGSYVAEVLAWAARYEPPAAGTAG